MLEFNSEHKIADLSSIKSKISKAENFGKVIVAGVAISSVMLLSGCVNSHTVTNEPNNEPNIEDPFKTSSAIIMENGNAMIVDVTEVKSFAADSDVRAVGYYETDRTYLLTTVSGDEILVDSGSFKLISGEDSHQKAETIAQSLISENGQITCYDEIETFGKTR